MMQAIEDIIKAIFNFKFIGRTLVKRPIGITALSFLLLVIASVAVLGPWYASIAGSFIDTGLGVLQPKLPTFNIINGQLQMFTSEPFILTHDDLYEAINEAAIIVDREHLKGRYAGEIAKGFNQTNKDTFCVIMDTTDNYKTQVDLNSYSQYAVITKDSIEMVDRVKTFPGNTTAISDRVKQAVRFSPDLIDNISTPIKRFATIAIISLVTLFTPISLLFKALVTAFIIWLILLIVRKAKPYKVLYKISVYALAPVVTLSILERFGLVVHGLIPHLIYIICILVAASAVEGTKQA